MASIHRWSRTEVVRLKRKVPATCTSDGDFFPNLHYLLFSCFEQQHSACPFVGLAPVGVVSIRNLQSVLHEVFARESFASKASGVRSMRLSSVLIAERFGLPPVEHGLVLSVGNVHERSHTLVRRHGYGREEIAGAHCMYSLCFLCG